MLYLTRSIPLRRTPLLTPQFLTRSQVRRAATAFARRTPDADAPLEEEDEGPLGWWRNETNSREVDRSYLFDWMISSVSLVFLK